MPTTSIPHLPRRFIQIDANLTGAFIKPVKHLCDARKMMNPDGTVFVQRSWIPKPGIHDVSSPLVDQGMLRVMTYNILADWFIRDGEYTYCPPEMRYLRDRHHRIMQEVEYVSPDVLCLQEVSRPYFDELLEPDMFEAGFEGFHASYKDENKDGLAVFYNRSRLDLIGKKACPALGSIETYLQVSSSSPLL